MNLRNNAISVLTDLKNVIENLSDECFCLSSDLLFGSTIGQHCRHIIEFYKCLKLQSEQGFVNYDLRKRQPEIENSRIKAVESLAHIIHWLKEITSDFSLKLHVNNSLNEAIPEEIDSSLFREIAFNIEHAIHHMAILKIGIFSILPDFEFPDNFGVAPSTVRHYKKLQTAN
jgi:hypothetical protein